MPRARRFKQLGVTACLPLIALALSGCANSKLFGTFGGEDATAESAVAPEVQAAPASAAPTAVTALDPLNAPPPGATASSATDPMLVPAPTAAPSSQSSQRVPLGSLSPNAPAPGQPVALAPAQRPPVPAAAPSPRPEAPAPAPTREMVPVEAAPSAAPVKRPPIAEAPAAPMKTDRGDDETVVISSATASRPMPQTREFVPASLTPQLPTPNNAPGEISLAPRERNIVQRFQALKRLEDQALITQDEYMRRRNANIGALLPYTREPPSRGLERTVPSSDAISARLSALRRAFEMRAITAQQHALERTMILNALLPEVPEEREVRKPPPRDMIEGASLVGFLEALRADGLITTSEFEGEKSAVEHVLRTGLLPSQVVAKDDKKGAKVAAAPSSKPAAPAAPADDPMSNEITGPVLHIASYSSEASAKRGWDEVMSRNRAILGTIKPIIRRVDLGPDKGIFYRLMAGSFPTMQAAEATCVKLKENNQFCRPSADGG